MKEVFLGSDHAGFHVKKKVKEFLDKKKIPYHDLGPYQEEKHDDYPDYAFKVAQKVAKDKEAKGILVCGTGVGMTIAANKVPGIRAVAAYDSYSAKMSREDNDANILGLRGRNFPLKKIESIILIWLNTKFSKKSRHERRIQKIARYERR
ncbi:ribose 5-phosphate isomerase B [Candidatus Pacearchaeota archaeon]|nr:ribose 5-phosphate isomerase B [Candidatus Pacearchaeota archaeon]